MSQPAATLGVIAGNGWLPAELVKSCRQQNRSVFVLGFDTTDMKPYSDVPHAQVRHGAIGEALAKLRAANVREVVLAGHVKRPSIWSLRPDAAGAKLMARLGAQLFSGDDALLKGLVRFLEEEGFAVVGAENIIHDLLTPEGVLSNIAPDAKDASDIALGMQAAKELGARDLGQAVIVDRGKIIGREDEEGTDTLIARCSGGILVKASKPGQEMRVDLPSIGEETVTRAHKSGLRGIALEAGHSFLLNKAETLAAADTLGLFIVGARHG